ncbi:MAG: sulfur carrier protein [Actinoplanes sp.]|jgi:sulfur carrier protein|nr:sulfur carrier protein [Actinoplanes sp.]
MQLTVNGISREVTGAFSVGALVAQLTGAQLAGAQCGVAVAVNGEVVPRSTWATASLRDGDRVEVLTAAQGG